MCFSCLCLFIKLFFSCRVSSLTCICNPISLLFVTLPPVSTPLQSFHPLPCQSHPLKKKDEYFALLGGFVFPVIIFDIMSIVVEELLSFVSFSLLLFLTAFPSHSQVPLHCSHFLFFSTFIPVLLSVSVLSPFYLILLMSFILHSLS